MTAGMAETLFEGEHLRMRGHWLDRSRPLVISFGSRIEGKVPTRGFGEEFLRERGFNFVCFIPKRNLWWHTPELRLAAERVGLRQLAAEFADVVSYGSSMGGHGAIVGAQLCGARRIVAFSPQFSLHRGDLPLDPTWQFEMKGVEEQYRIDPRWSSGIHVDLVYDPLHGMDRAHAKALGEHARVREVRVPLSGHFAAGMLRNCGLLACTVESLLEGRFDPVAFRGELRRRKRGLVEYWLGIVRESTARPALRKAAHRQALQLAIRQIEAGEPELAHRQLVPLIRDHCLHIARRGQAAEADRIAGLYASKYPDLVHGPLVQAELAMMRGDWGAADAATSRALAMRRKDLDAMLLRARICMASGRWPQAAAVLQACLELPAGNAKAWVGMGRMAAAAGGLDPATRVAVITRAVSLCPPGADRRHLLERLGQLQGGGSPEPAW